MEDLGFLNPHLADLDGLDEIPSLMLDHSYSLLDRSQDASDTEQPPDVDSVHVDADKFGNMPTNPELDNASTNPESLLLNTPEKNHLHDSVYLSMSDDVANNTNYLIDANSVASANDNMRDSSINPKQIVALKTSTPNAKVRVRENIRFTPVTSLKNTKLAVSKSIERAAVQPHEQGAQVLVGDWLKVILTNDSLVGDQDDKSSACHAIRGSDTTEDVFVEDEEDEDISEYLCDRTQHPEEVPSTLNAGHSNAKDTNALPSALPSALPPFGCPICQKQFLGESQIQSHFEQVHDGAVSFVCTICFKRFDSNSQLRTHVSSVHDKLNQSPETSSESFKNGRTPLDTMSDHNYITYCESDDGASDIDSTLNNSSMHLKAKPGVTLQMGQVPKKVVAQQDVSAGQHAIEHSPRKTPTKPTCNICRKVFTSQFYLTAHQERLHNLKTSKSPSQSSLTCIICGKIFSSQAYLIRHRERAHGLQLHGNHGDSPVQKLLKRRQNAAVGKKSNRKGYKQKVNQKEIPGKASVVMIYPDQFDGVEKGPSDSNQGLQKLLKPQENVAVGQKSNQKGSQQQVYQKEIPEKVSVEEVHHDDGAKVPSDSNQDPLVFDDSTEIWETNLETVMDEIMVVQEEVIETAQDFISPPTPEPDVDIPDYIEQHSESVVASNHTDAPSLIHYLGSKSSGDKNVCRELQLQLEEMGEMFRCKMCNLTGPDKYRMLVHVKRHSGMHNHKCDICGKMFMNKRNKKNHMLVHDNEKRFLCKMCGNTYKQLSSLNNHLRTHRMEKPYRCSVCKEHFTSRGILEKHRMIHGFKSWDCGEDGLMCEFCGISFPTSRDLNQHLPSHYPNPLTSQKRKKKETGANKDQEVRFECEVCKKMIAKNHMKVHMRRHNGEKPYVCGICGMGFVTRSGCKNHLVVHEEGRSYLCALCGKSFKQKSSLRVHNHAVHEARRLRCTICDETFSSRYQVLKHKRDVHFGCRGHQCQECGLEFYTRTALKSHMVTHTGERRFICDVCGQAFTQMGALKGHRRTHTGEKPYACSYCGKKFATNSTMRAHEKIHLGRVYHCDICNKDFNQPSYYRSHMDRHSGKSYPCEVCGKEFTTTSHRSRHMKAVHHHQKKKKQKKQCSGATGSSITYDPDRDWIMDL